MSGTEKEARAARRAADELERTGGAIHMPDGSTVTGGRCTEQALRRHGGSVAGATKAFGERPFRAYTRAGGDPADAVSKLRKHADDVDAKGVTPQTPTREHEPKPERKPQGHQRPGGRGVKKPCVRTVPAPPQVSRKRSKPTLIVVAVLLLVVLANVAAIVAALLYALVVLAGTAVGLALGYVNGRWLVPGAYRLTVQAIEQRRARPEPTPVLVPDAVVMPVTATEQAQLEAAWMPKARPDYAPAAGGRTRRKV